MTGVPAGLPLVAVSVTERSKASWAAGLVFSAADGYCPVRGAVPGTLTIAASAYVPGIGWGGGQSNATVDGHQANRDHQGEAEGLAVFDVPGPQVSVAAGDQATLRLLGPDGLTRLYRAVTVLGAAPNSPTEAPDTSAWTDTPMR
ncbi:hypothetical protein Lfu02_69840 [Longispora fulva]|uniref:Uncharacterized protein n=1 Tax=Longispora fulva TaxID=619741 RepID=A0A8J7GMQ0_9ACTN|nr:hypothetical protein [Longispora fulva]MBG6134473.1 hypothetical protein [Longispora fulva]GIG62612.1 hypothetical protein Lfu02_69840 [Longispora fulva]